jgi:UDP-GlcNAc3NAcA epimerase
MTSRKILTIIGARPQFIKASAVSAAIAACPRLTEIVVHTGQHFDPNMSDVFFPELGMEKPAYHLAIHGCGHGEMTGRMLIDIEKVIQAERPAAVLVYGDTNSTLAGALAAAKLHVPVAHVEAGLRSFNMAMPEEINRILTDRVSEWLFTPTHAADQHLLREGVADQRIHRVGDVMFDVALRHGAHASAHSDDVRKLGPMLQSQPYCLATIHRAENTDNPARLAIIVESLTAFAEQTRVIWPLHPRTRAVLAKQGALEGLARTVTLLDPLGYLDMVYLEKHAALIATDSGGIQKEAFFYRVPCVTLRDETEWTELVEGGWNRLAPPTEAAVVLAALCAGLGTRGDDIMPYGCGNAAERIIQQLVMDLD